MRKCGSKNSTAPWICTTAGTSCIPRNTRHSPGSACAPRSCAARTPGCWPGRETPPEIWEELFDVWGRGVPCPSVYNEAAYRSGIRHGSDAKGADRDRFAFGGCTELMFEGCSNIGSTEGGLNLLDILNNSTPSRFRADIRLRMEEFASAVRANSEFAAQYRPQLIRTLFVDDCIDRNREFNAGGARYYGSIVNVAGLTDAANSLAAMRGIPEKFGNDSPEVDEIARKLAHHVFSLIRRYPMRQGGRPIRRSSC